VVTLKSAGMVTVFTPELNFNRNFMVHGPNPATLEMHSLDYTQNITPASASHHTYLGWHSPRFPLKAFFKYFQKQGIVFLQTSSNG
jgi:hypothetical protein